MRQAGCALVFSFCVAVSAGLNLSADDVRRLEPLQTIPSSDECHLSVSTQRDDDDQPARPQKTGSVTRPNAQYSHAYLFQTLAGRGNGHVDGDVDVAMFRAPEGIAADKDGNLYITEYRSSIVRKISSDGVVSTLAGKPMELGSADGPGGEARFNRPHGVDVDVRRNVYVTDMVNCTVRKITPDGNVTTLAGIPEIQGANDGAASQATFNRPEDIAVGSDGTLYIADTYNCTVRKLSTDGIVTTLAGKAGEKGHLDGPGQKARFNMPIGLAIDGSGSIYVADADYDGEHAGNCVIRKISPQGDVSTIAGMAGVTGSEDGVGRAARFHEPVGIDVTPDGVIFVADSEADTIRMRLLNGRVVTIGGKYLVEDKQDGLGSDARFKDPQAIAVDKDGVLYVADTLNHRICKGTPQTFGSP